MGVATQLQVNTILLSLLQMIWLMVQQDEIIVTGNTLHQLFDALAGVVAAVIAADNGHVANAHRFIHQQANPALLDPVDGFVNARDILMVA